MPDELKLNPCVCGCTDIAVHETHEKKLHTYTMFCRNTDCHEEPISVFSHSKVLGSRRAVKAWNERNKEQK